ncbi:transposase [Cucumis melo var. makuwa]|uniref:Transposase n=1 Tax=Cucumis melo var. makuwa TaxID=1194695 RepID=A0A5D3BTB1_CUCMM|nr:transposase [Cucumis melo var. makuwa]
MKFLKNYVRNRHRLEGCIAESYIVEEAIEFCSDFLSGVDPVGLGIDRLDASLDNSSFVRPLSAGVSFKPEQDLLYQAHRYVLANTIDVQPYIDKHVEVLQLKYLNKVLHQKWIQEEHNRTFISWLREEVASEIGMGNVEISDNLRWIAHGPHPFVIKYNSYVINGCRYHTESYDKNRSVQNSGVSLVAKTMQVSSSKDKNSTIGDMSFYGVIQDIWELNYNTFNVAMFRCDWVKNNNDKIFTLKIQVMLDGQLCLLHHREIVKINQMTMNLEISCYIVKEYIVICQMSMKDILFTHGANDSKRRSRQGGERKLVKYNEDGVPIGENGVKLNSFIGSCVHYHIPIIYATWIDVPAELKEKIYTIVEVAFIIDNRSRKRILKTAGTTFRQFKHWLTKKYILPFKNEPELLKRPPYMYSYIDQKHWEEFVKSRLCPHFEDKRKLQQERRKKNNYNHRLSRKGYANLREELKNIPSEESELGRASMWKKARVDKKEQYDNEDVQEVVNRIDEISKTCADKESSPNDVLTQALGTRESSGRVCGVGGFVTPIKEEVNVDVIILNDLQEDAIEVRNEKEVVYLGIRYELPFTLFGIGRKTCVLREDIIDFCNMYLHSQDELSNYIFIDPSLISVGHNTQEVRARNLCNRLMVSKPNQLVLAPFNPGGHWALLAINIYDETVYYLDSLRTTSRVDIRYVTYTAITIFRSQKNIQTSRKQPIWKIVKCHLQVGVVECGYYVMRYMRDIITHGSIIVTYVINTRTSYSQLQLDEV